MSSEGRKPKRRRLQPGPGQRPKGRPQGQRDDGPAKGKPQAGDGPSKSGPKGNPRGGPQGQGKYGRPPGRPQGRPQGKGHGGPRGGPRRERPEPVVETMSPTTLPALQRQERQMFVVSDRPSDPAYGHRPDKRPIEELLRYGVVILDKPRGPTSHQVVAWLRDILDVEKVGHGGTLDPKVTGVLPTTVGDATKAVGALLTVGKEYIAVLRLHGDADEETIRKEARRFIGRVRQVPPVRSAVARRGRIRRIYDLEVLEIKGRDVLLRVQSEAGTYIRNLCVDLGHAIGTRGHMAELRRSRTGVFHESQAVTLHDVLDAVTFWKEDGDETFLRQVLLPFERVVAHLPQIRLRDSAVDAVCHGADLNVPGVAAIEEGIAPGTDVVLVSGKGEAVALAKATLATEAILEAESGRVADLERVLMRPGTYPAVWKRTKTETRRL